MYVRSEMTNDDMARAAEKDAPPEYRGEGKGSEKEKLRRVRRHAENGETVLMVGDLSVLCSAEDDCPCDDVGMPREE